MADEGAARLAQLLKKSDQLGVLAVDSVPKWRIRSVSSAIRPRQWMRLPRSARVGAGFTFTPDWRKRTAR